LKNRTNFWEWGEKTELVPSASDIFLSSTMGKEVTIEDPLIFLLDGFDEGKKVGKGRTRGRKYGRRSSETDGTLTSGPY